MSFTIPLQAIPNQQFTITLENHGFDITLRSDSISGMTYATILKDGVTIVSGERVVAGGPIIPFPYLEGDAGNFTITTLNDAIPDYTEFGSTQTLIYATAAEIAAVRAA